MTIVVINKIFNLGIKMIWFFAFNEFLAGFANRMIIMSKISIVGISMFFVRKQIGILSKEGTVFIKL